MPSEREDSIREGIHPPDESPAAREAAEEKKRRDAEAPEIGGGMGGTSDADRPADESNYGAQRREADARETKKTEGDQNEGDQDETRSG